MSPPSSCKPDVVQGVSNSGRHDGGDPGLEITLEGGSGRENWSDPGLLPRRPIFAERPPSVLPTDSFGSCGAGHDLAPNGRSTSES